MPNQVKLKAAQAWAERGFRVFPCQPNGKKPMREGWPEWASSDRDKITEWWTAEPHANIGVLTGGKLLVIDLDQKGGRDGCGSWLAQDGAFGTLQVATPSGGAVSVLP